MAELMAKGHSPLAAEFGMDRFREGRFIDESVAAGGWRIDDADPEPERPSSRFHCEPVSQGRRPMADKRYNKTLDPRTDAPGLHAPNAATANDPRDPDGGRAHDPLAGRTDEPDPVPEADFRDITPTDRRRERMFGGVLRLRHSIWRSSLLASSCGRPISAVTTPRSTRPDTPDVVEGGQPMEPAETE